MVKLTKRRRSTGEESKMSKDCKASKISKNELVKEQEGRGKGVIEMEESKFFSDFDFTPFCKWLKGKLFIALYIPNLFCYLRIGLSFWLLYKSLITSRKNQKGENDGSEGKEIFTFILLYIFALITDYLDGFLARLLHQESKHIKSYDPTISIKKT